MEIRKCIFIVVAILLVIVTSSCKEKVPFHVSEKVYYSHYSFTYIDNENRVNTRVCNRIDKSDYIMSQIKDVKALIREENRSLVDSSISSVKVWWIQKVNTGGSGAIQYTAWIYTTKQPDCEKITPTVKKRIDSAYLRGLKEQGIKL